MSQYRFSVKMFDFSASNLAATEPNLKLDWDRFKLFMTDKEKGGNPEWGFKASFMYRIRALEKLASRLFRITCFDAVEKPAEKVSVEVDLATLACGPSTVKLTLTNAAGKPSGSVQFQCVMKMFSTGFTVGFDRICLTMQGSPAPARLHISMAEENELRVPYSAKGEWEDLSLTSEASLSDMLSVVEPSHITVKVFDENLEVLVGEVKINLRTHLSLDSSKSIAVTQDVVYQHGEFAGTVGELAGTIVFKNLPIYAQMEGGLLVDDGVEGGYLLLDGLPYPARCSSTPPTFQDDYLLEHRRIIPPVPGDRSDDENDINILYAGYQSLEVLDVREAELPPYWEMKKTLTARPYFIDHRTMGTTWKDPRFLPENWDQRIDPDNGMIYYAFHTTRQTTYKDPRGLNDSWAMCISRKGQVYFVYLPKRKSHFADPRGLPMGYDAMIDAKGHLYFRNHNNKTTQWNDPRNDSSPDEKRRFLELEHRAWWKAQIEIALENSMNEAVPVDELELDDDDSNHGQDGINGKARKKGEVRKSEARREALKKLSL